MKMSYYPGCSLEGTAVDYDRTVRQVFSHLGIELEEIRDWNCCGASSAHMTDHEAGIRLPMRNLLLARENQDILVPCAACFQRLKAADKALRENPEYWGVTAYNPQFEIIHITSFLAKEETLRNIEKLRTVALADLKLACYYGCLSLRNPRVTDADNWEMPDKLERIVSSLGATPCRWSHRTECCSGSLTMTRPDIARRLVADIVDAARRPGAQAMVTDCPMCQANVESRQLDLAQDAEALPVFYITELIAAAIEGDYPARQQKAHLVHPATLIDTIRDVTLAKENTP